MPPGTSAMIKARRNQNALIPKNSARPPQTPATILLLRDRLNVFETFAMLNLQFTILILYTQNKTAKLHENRHRTTKNLAEITRRP
jgi:hypothetical protein